MYGLLEMCTTTWQIASFGEKTRVLVGLSDTLLTRFSPACMHACMCSMGQCTSVDQSRQMFNLEDREEGRAEGRDDPRSGRWGPPAGKDYL